MTKERNESIRRMRAEGKTYAAIAKEFDLTRERVAQICKPKTRKPFNLEFAQECKEYLERFGYRVTPPEDGKK